MSLYGISLRDQQNLTQRPDSFTSDSEPVETVGSTPSIKANPSAESEYFIEIVLRKTELYENGGSFSYPAAWYELSLSPSQLKVFQSGAGSIKLTDERRELLLQLLSDEYDVDNLDFDNPELSIRLKSRNDIRFRMPINDNPERVSIQFQDGHKTEFNNTYQDTYRGWPTDYLDSDGDLSERELSHLMASLSVKERKDLCTTSTIYADEEPQSCSQKLARQVRRQVTNSNLRDGLENFVWGDFHKIAPMISVSGGWAGPFQRGIFDLRGGVGIFLGNFDTGSYSLARIDTFDVGVRGLYNFQLLDAAIIEADGSNRTKTGERMLITRHSIIAEPVVQLSYVSLSTPIAGTLKTAEHSNPTNEELSSLTVGLRGCFSIPFTWGLTHVCAESSNLLYRNNSQEPRNIMFGAQFGW